LPITVEQLKVGDVVVVRRSDGAGGVVVDRAVVVRLYPVVGEWGEGIKYGVPGIEYTLISAPDGGVFWCYEHQILQKC
jgi:hypothetical protein